MVLSQSSFWRHDSCATALPSPTLSSPLLSGEHANPLPRSGGVEPGLIHMDISKSAIPPLVASRGLVEDETTRSLL